MKERETVRAKIDFDGRDFLINGSNLYHLIMQKNKSEGKFIPSSIICQPNAVQRLSGIAEPDLINGLIAIYNCEMCGGYDGSQVGVNLLIGDNQVYWKDIGYSTDEPVFAWEHRPFPHIPDYVFTKENYDVFLETASRHRVK